MPEISTTHNGIGLLKENSLHAALKAWYAQPGDCLEAGIDGYVIDIVRNDLLIEIQSGNFAAIRRKLEALLERYPVRLVYPIAVEKTIIKQAESPGGRETRRRSPRRGCLEHLFLELVRLPDLVPRPGFSLEVILTREEEIQVKDGRGSWRRRGWSIHDRRLVEVTGRVLFSGPDDYCALLPVGLPASFTTRDLSAGLGQPLYLAQKMAYCLRRMNVLVPAGKRGRSVLYLLETP
jgi:hypothetical protein